MDNKTKKLVKSVLSVVLAFFIYKIISIFTNKLPVNEPLHMFIKEVIFCILALVAAKINGRLDTLKFKTEGFGIGLLICAISAVSSIISLVGSLFDGSIEVTVGPFFVVLFVIAIFILAITEELLFRGILINGFLDYFGENKTYNIRKAVIASGIAFGALHFFNIITGSSFSGALIQAISNIGSGILFGAAYVRARKNIWPGIIVHMIIDVSSFVTSGILANVTMSEVISGFSLVSFVIPVIELAIGLFALRKTKLLPLRKKKKDA